MMKFAIEQLFKEIQMDLSKLVSNAFITSLTVIGVSIFVPFQKVYAEDIPVCPDPSTTTITSINDFTETTGGFCRSTPDKYGVTVFKMGFCTKNPGNPTGSSILEGSTPDYSSCTWAYENSSGEVADFSAGGSIDLSEVASSIPAAGTYPHAVMLISHDFRIKGKYGPVAGQTFYTTETFGDSTTDISDWKTTTAPLKSFSGPTKCTATTEGEVVVGGTISAYLLDSTGTILVSDLTDTGAPCTGMVKLLGVMNMANNLTISETTKGLKMTFIVTDNGMSVMTNSGDVFPPTEIIMDSGSFSVTFETF